MMLQRVPHRIKGLLKRDAFDPTSPPPPFTKTPLMARIFTSHHRNKKITKLKDKQWKNNDMRVTLDFNEVPLRATNMMSMFHQQQRQQQQHGWSSLLAHHGGKLDPLAQVYVSTLGKVRSLGHYNLEQQLAIHNMLTGLQKNTGLQQRNTSQMLSNHVYDSSLLIKAKAKRTRYIFMLLSTPAASVTDKVHPVTEALLKLRKPYAETLFITTSDMVEPKVEVVVEEVIKLDNPLRHFVAYKFGPADYLLDPATLRGPDEPHNTNRLGTKLDGNTWIDQKQPHHQQQQQHNNNNNNNNSSQNITHIMAKIQIQTN